MKNYDEAIKCLQLERESISWDAIKSSYKKLALHLHPDKTEGKEDNKFKELSTAYELLAQIYNPNNLMDLRLDELAFIAKTLGNSSAQTLHVITEAINKTNPKINQSIVFLTELQLAHNLNYTAASVSKSRVHAYQATTAEYHVQDIYENMKGDRLKTAILIDFSQSLEGLAGNELMEKIDAFQKSDEYKILQKPQGIATSFFKLKTDSVKSCEKICARRVNASTDQHKIFKGKGPVMGIFHPPRSQSIPPALDDLKLKL